MTPKLNAAAFAGNLAEVERLLASGADPSSKDGDAYTPLHEASQVGHAEIVQRLIAAGANVEAKDRWGCSPLHEAARFGQDAVCKVLLECGAPIEAKGFEDRTPLHYAAMEGNASTASLLLGAGADPHAKSLIVEEGGARRIIQGKTPLHLAAASGSLFKPESAKAPEAYVEVAQILINSGASVNASEKAIGSEYPHLDIDRSRSGVQGSWNCQPIHMATTPEMVKCLAGNGADLNRDTVWQEKIFQGATRTDHGTGTPFRNAITNARNDIAVALLECGAIPNDRDKKALTPEKSAELDAVMLANRTRAAAGTWRTASAEDDLSPMRVPSPDPKPRAHLTPGQIAEAVDEYDRYASTARRL